MKRAAVGYVVVPVVLLVVFQVVPFGYGLGLAFTETTPFSSGWVGLRNFAELFESELFWRSLWTSIKFVAVVVPCVVGVSLIVALKIFSMSKVKRQVLRILFYLPTILATMVLSLVWRWMFAQEGFINSGLVWLGMNAVPFLSSNPQAFYSISSILILQQLGPPILLWMAVLSTIPKERYEAASLDGAGFWGQTWHVTLPGVWPMATVITLLQAVGVIQIWAFPYFMTGGGPNYATYSLLLGMWQTITLEGRYGKAAAYAMIVVVILVALIITQRRLSRRFE